MPFDTIVARVEGELGALVLDRPELNLLTSTRSRRRPVVRHTTA
jgi:hypothetical protein